MHRFTLVLDKAFPPFVFGVLVLIGTSFLTSTALGQRAIESPNVETQGRFGASVSEIGDLDGDDTPDLLVGAPGEIGSDETENSSAGRAYVLSGSDSSVLLTLTSSNPNSGGNFGTSVVGIGDVGGDATPDVLVGAPGETVDGDVNAGRAYVADGSDGSDIFVLSSPNSEEDGGFGQNLAVPGDLNQDGVPDLVVGAAGETVNGESGAGRAYVFSGTDGSLLHTLTSPEVQFLGDFGSAVSGAGDLNGDDVPEIVVGAPGEDEPTTGGHVHLFDGSNGDLLRSMSSPEAETSGQFGIAVAGTGDLNEDDTSDLLIGATESGEDLTASGRAYLLSGADGSSIQTLTSPQAEEFGFFGFDVESFGDVNGDGVSDLLVGAPEETVDGNEDTGRAYAFGGTDGTLLGTMNSLNPEGDGGEFGNALATLEDIDGDGRPDPVVGAFNEDMDSFDEGRAYIFRSATTEIPVELVSFTGSEIGDATVKLVWQTASETNNAAFQVQRRVGGVKPSAKAKWTTVGSVEGAGTTADQKRYRYVDEELPYGADQLTYRLKQVDMDGSVQYSEQVVIEREVAGVELLDTFPNPVQSQATIRYALPETREVTLRLYDMLGREVRTIVNAKRNGRHRTTLNVSELPSGIYFLRLRAGGTTKTQKLTVAR